MIAEDTISQVLERASILDFAQEVGSLRRQGKNVVALCPFHSEKSPSFHIRDDGRFYYCFGCRASGNALSFVMKMRGLSFPDAIRQLADLYSIEVKETKRSQPKQERRSQHLLRKINDLANTFFQGQLQSAPESVLQYLHSRKLSQETLVGFEVGYAPSEWRALTDYLRKARVPDALILESGLARKNTKGELYDALRGRVVFPIRSGDRHLIGFGGRSVPGDSHSDNDQSPKYINSPETRLYHKSQVLYGLPFAQEAARKSGEMFVVEGYFDVASFHQYGIAQTVATCGTALTADHVRLVRRLVNRVVLLFDGDQSGIDSS
ncbi:MAG: DNA primase, partial [Bdellovibrionales bacterium]|nr:DNA primase [Bdellovibrionales bacterium]